MSTRARIATGIAVLLCATSPLLAQVRQPDPDSTHLRLAREVIHASGADSMALRGVEMMVAMQRTSNPNVPANFWDEFLGHARTDLPQLIDSLTPVYASHFSRAELEQLNAFYATALGRRMVAEQRTLQDESARVGMRWGANIGAKVSATIMERGMPRR